MEDEESDLSRDSDADSHADTWSWVTNLDTAANLQPHHVLKTHTHKTYTHTHQVCYTVTAGDMWYVNKIT